MPAEPAAEPQEEGALTPEAAAQVASLDRVSDQLVADAQSWAVQLGELARLAARATQQGPQTRRTLALDLAGSWRVGQLTAERWVAQAERFHDARERLADRAAGISRTAEQRRADMFASLPALVLAGTAQDDAARRRAGLPVGGRVVPALPEDPQLFDTDAPALLPWSLLPEQVAAQMTINAHVPVATLLERSNAPGSIDGYGPVSAEYVRLVRPKSFRRVMVDACSGRPIAVDDKPTPAADTGAGRREQIRAMLRPDVVIDREEPQHDPSTRLARLVDLRDVHCCGSGCSSGRCDRDHLDPYPAGPTSAANLGLASPRCHSAKHHGWTLRRHPDGSVTWHSPLHRKYERPGPWDPPPEVDLWSDEPLVRARPAPPLTEDHDDIPLLDTLVRQDVEPVGETANETARTTCNGWPDDPPF